VGVVIIYTMCGTVYNKTIQYRFISYVHDTIFRLFRLYIATMMGNDGRDGGEGGNIISKVQHHMPNIHKYSR
jgi:hypothetical protein